MPARFRKPRWPPAARLVGAGTISPRIQIRNRSGRWVEESGIDDRSDSYVRCLLARFEDLAAWARAQGERAARRRARR